MKISQLVGALTRDPRQSQTSNSPAMQAAQQASQMVQRPMPAQRMPGPGPVPAMPRPNQPMPDYGTAGPMGRSNHPVARPNQFMPGPGAVPPMGRPNHPMPQPTWNDYLPNIPQGTNISDMVGRVHAYQTSNMPPQSMQDRAPQYSTQPMPNPMPNYGPGQQPQAPQMNRMILPTTTRGWTNY